MEGMNIWLRKQMALRPGCIPIEKSGGGWQGFSLETNGGGRRTDRRGRGLRDSACGRSSAAAFWQELLAQFA